jgi:hypothetical protein
MARRALIDTNLLVLLLVGSVSEALIVRHKRTRAYDIQSYRLLTDTLQAHFVAILTTPHVLAETSNLVRVGNENEHALLSEQLARWTGRCDERHVPAVEVVGRSEYVRLGLTDAGLLSLATDEDVLITDDLDLYLEASRRGAKVINFNHLRAQLD